MGNLRVDESAQARIADIDIAPGGPRDNIEGYRNGFAVAHFAFVNTGNRAAVVLQAEYVANQTPALLAGAFGAPVTTEKEVFPLLLLPHEIRVINLRMPFSHLISNYENGAPSDNPNSTPQDPLRTFFCGFTFRTLDSQGAVHDAWTGMEFKVDVSKTKLGGLGPIRPTSQYPLTQLLTRINSERGASQ